MARGHYRFTPEDAARMVDMREAGLTCAAIAADFGCSTGLVEYHCLRMGAVPPARRRAFFPQAAGGTHIRNGRIVRRFDAAEDARLLALDAAGVAPAEIARALGRKHHTIVLRMATLARHEAYAEAAE